MSEIEKDFQARVTVKENDLITVDQNVRYEDECEQILTVIKDKLSALIKKHRNEGICFPDSLNITVNFQQPLVLMQLKKRPETNRSMGELENGLQSLRGCFPLTEQSQTLPPSGTKVRDLMTDMFEARAVSKRLFFEEVPRPNTGETPSASLEKMNEVLKMNEISKTPKDKSEK